MKTLLLASAALTLAGGAFAGAANAQEWAGPYVGGHFGYANIDDGDRETIQFDTDLDGRFGDTVNTTAPANAFSPGFCSGAARTAVPIDGCSEEGDSVDVGLRAGYDWQFGPMVFGVVGEIGKVDIEDSVSGFSTTPASYTMTREINWNAGLRVRGGYAFDRFLVYGTAGPSYAKVESSFRTTNGANDFTGRGEDDGVWGYQAGFGGEARMTGNWTLGVEYLYSNYEDDGYRVRASQGTAPATNPFILVDPAGTDFRRSDSDLSFHTIRATVTYRF
jgi:outer membrane immunogenic protein